jgi:hypothetical protein
MPKKTDIRERYQVQMTQLKNLAGDAEKALNNEGQPSWMLPERNGWDGNLFDIPGMKEPFDRREMYDDFVDVVKDASSPGVTADLTAIQLQGDFLAAMERAFRERHKTKIRCNVQAAARQMGHNQAVLETMMTGYIQRQLTKGAGGS